MTKLEKLIDDVNKGNVTMVDFMDGETVYEIVSTSDGKYDLKDDCGEVFRTLDDIEELYQNDVGVSVEEYFNIDS